MRYDDTRTWRLNTPTVLSRALPVPGGGLD